MDRFDREAFEFVSGQTARRAFDVSKEDPRLRDQYGRHNWGQSTLLARRLVEAGSTFVTRPLRRLGPSLGPQEGHEELPADGGHCRVGAVRDLDDRGLLETTLVVLCGEFSRTPKMNDGGNGGAGGAWARPAATTGATRCSACWAAAASRAAGRRLDRPAGHAAGHAAAVAIQTSTPRFIGCSASTRKSRCPTRAAGRCRCWTTRRRLRNCWRSQVAARHTNPGRGDRRPRRPRRRDANRRRPPAMFPSHREWAARRTYAVLRRRPHAPTVRYVPWMPKIAPIRKSKRRVVSSTRRRPVPFRQQGRRVVDAVAEVLQRLLLGRADARPSAPSSGARSASTFWRRKITWFIAFSYSAR